jgi:hypothetical protein
VVKSLKKTVAAAQAAPALWFPTLCPTPVTASDPGKVRLGSGCITGEFVPLPAAAKRLK